MADPKNAAKNTRPVSQARIEANRRNAQKSTGPRTPEGRRASSMNAVTHGLHCETVEPEDQRELIDARVAEWSGDLKPEGAAQRWMVRRAAAASVRLDLCLEAEVSRRESAAERAEAKYVREAKYRVGKLGEGFDHNPLFVVEALEATAFGCEWLIAELSSLARDLADEDGYLGGYERMRAVRMLGLDPERQAYGETHPVAGPFMRAALANDPDHNPDEADLWLGIDTSGLDAAARRAKHAELLPTRVAGRLHGLEVVTDRIRELEALRDERLDEVDGPAIDEARRRAMLRSVGTKAAERLRRYESGHSLDLHRSLATLAKLRKEAEHAARSAPEPASAAWTPAPKPTDPAARSEAPNEPNPAEDEIENDDPEMTCDDPSATLPMTDPTPDASEETPPSPDGWA
jgi:hypothetical protein